MSKSSITENIQVVLGDYKARRIQFAADQEKHEAAVKAEKNLTALISQAGTPCYTDKIALDSLESLKRQLAACQAEIKGRENFRQDLGDAVEAFLREGFSAVRLLLWDAHQDLADRVTAKLLPFYATRERASEFALNTDAVISAKEFIEALQNMTSLQFHTRDDRNPFVVQMEQMLKEAMKDKPDLGQFFGPVRDSRKRPI